MSLPKPRATAETWKRITGYGLHERPILLIVWQEAPNLGRVFKIPCSDVPDKWLELLWMANDVYLDNDQKLGINDTVTSTVRLLALLTWPKHERRLKKGEFQIKHTNFSYRVRDLVGAWNQFFIPTKRFSRVKPESVAMTVRTGRWSPKD